MGDIADWVNASMQEAYPEWSPVGSKRRAHRPPLKCKGCGATGLYWQRVGGQYKIHERGTLIAHVCPVRTSAFSAQPE